MFHSFDYYPAANGDCSLPVVEMFDYGTVASLSFNGEFSHSRWETKLEVGRARHLGRYRLLSGYRRRRHPYCGGRRCGRDQQLWTVALGAVELPDNALSAKPVARKPLLEHHKCSWDAYILEADNVRVHSHFCCSRLG